MKKLLCMLFVFIMSIGLINAQNQSYTYQKYGIINQYTNNMVLEVDDILKFTQNKSDSFLIQISDPLSAKNPVYTLVVSLKGYDELNEQYVYIGDAIEVLDKNQALIYKGKCLVNSNSKLDIYLKNQGCNYEETYDNSLSFSVYFNKMKTDKEGYIPQLPNSFIRIFPIKNKSKEEIKENELRNEKRLEYSKNEVEEIESILAEVNIEEKLQSIQNNITDYYRNKTKDIILNTPIKQLLQEKVTNKKATLNYDFVLLIDKDKNVSIIKDKRIYNFPYYNYNEEHPFGEYKERKINPLMLSLKEECRNRYFIDGCTYYKADSILFLDNYELHQNINFETDIIGVKVKGENLKYYSDENKISQFEEVHDWCSKNIIGKGFHYIHYIIIDSKLYCKEINPNRDELEYLKRYLK
ncbi:hypothetical protein AAAU94_06215 [Bacteroides cellulosilyticus]|uniref:hypothetical protein n=1 Tax=Bacteroides cellulosilyticus TaxID=246787 RepID=UPI0032C10627